MPANTKLDPTAPWRWEAPRVSSVALAGQIRTSIRDKSEWFVHSRRPSASSSTRSLRGLASSGSRYPMQNGRSDPDFIVDPRLPEQLASEMSDEEYEKKVVGLLDRSFVADVEVSPQKGGSVEAGGCSTSRRRPLYSRHARRSGRRTAEALVAVVAVTMPANRRWT